MISYNSPKRLNGFGVPWMSLLTHNLDVEQKFRATWAAAESNNHGQTGGGRGGLAGGQMVQQQMGPQAFFTRSAMEPYSNYSPILPMPPLSTFGLSHHALVSPRHGTTEFGMLQTEEAKETAGPFWQLEDFGRRTGGAGGAAVPRAGKEAREQRPRLPAVVMSDENDLKPDEMGQYSAHVPGHRAFVAPAENEMCYPGGRTIRRRFSWLERRVQYQVPKPNVLASEANRISFQDGVLQGPSPPRNTGRGASNGPRGSVSATSPRRNNLQGAGMFTSSPKADSKNGMPRILDKLCLTESAKAPAKSPRRR